MADLDSLQIKIKADANNASIALDKLANSLTNFQKSLSIDTSKLTIISNSIQSIANAANSHTRNTPMTQTAITILRFTGFFSMVIPPILSLRSCFES